MATKFATKRVREQAKRQIQQMEKTIANPVAWDKIQDKQRYNKQLNDERTRLASITPPELTEDQKKIVAKRQHKLVDAMKKGSQTLGVPPMPPEEDMWKTPAGSIGRHTSWERFWKDHNIDADGNILKAKDKYGAIDQWKDGQRALYPEREEDDPDIANIETFRPRSATGGSRFIDYPSMTMAPGSNLTHEEYNQIFDRQPTPMEQKIAEGEEILSEKKILKYLEDNPDVKERLFVSQSDGTLTGRCQAHNQDGTQCQREAKDGEEHCGFPKHKEQIELSQPINQ